MRKYEEPELPVRGWKDWLMGPGEETKDFEKSLKAESLRRHTDLLERDMELLCKQIESRSRELNKYNVSLRDQLRKHGEWTWSEEKYPNPEYVRKAREEFVLFYETEFTPTLEILTSAIEEYKSSSGGGGRYNNVIKVYQLCIDKTKEEGQKYIEAFIDLEENSVKAINKKVKEQKEQENAPGGPGIFGDFKQTYVNEKPKSAPKPKSTPKTPQPPKPKKTIKKTTQATPTLVPSQYFRDQVKRYLKKDMTTPVAPKAEIKKAWQKLSLHIQANSTKYNKLPTSEQQAEADEIFKRVTNEKEKLCPVTSGKGKKTKKGKKSKKGKQGKKSKKGK